MNVFPQPVPKKYDLSDAKEIFARTGWMASRDPAVRDTLLSLGRPRFFAAGDTLYRLADTPDGIYGLMQGRVCVSIPNDAGSVFDCYMANPGFWIGDLALLAKAMRLVTVTASTDVEAWFLPQPALMGLVRQRPELVADFYALNHLNMMVALRTMANLSIPDAARRLSAWLLYTDETQGGADRWIETAQEQVALMNAMSLPTARRVLKRLADRGFIELGYGRLRVSDRAGLSRFCAG